MSCSTMRPTRRSRSVCDASSMAAAAAFSHDSLLVPTSSMTLYTLSDMSLLLWRCYFFCLFFTQLALEDFPGGSHGHSIAELDEPRIFVGRHLLFTPYRHLLDCHSRTRLANDKGFYLLAKYGMRHADDRRQRDVRMGHQHFFQLTRVDIVPASQYHVFLPVDNEEVAILIDVCNIAGMEPSASHRFGGGLRAMVIPFHDAMAAHDDLTMLAREHLTV